MPAEPGVPVGSQPLPHDESNDEPSADEPADIDIDQPENAR